MKRTIEVEDFGEIQIMPEDTTEEIVQNIGMITTMALGSGPMCRELGVSQETTGMRDLAARALLTRDIYTAVQDQEPRVSLRNVEFQSGGNGVHDAVMEVELDG